MVPRRIFQLSWNKEDEEEDEREKREKKKKKSVGRVCGNPRIFEKLGRDKSAVKGIQARSTSVPTSPPR